MLLNNYRDLIGKLRMLYYSILLCLVPKRPRFSPNSWRDYTTSNTVVNISNYYAIQIKNRISVSLRFSAKLT